MHQFLSTGLPPKEMNRDERERLAVKSRHFGLLQDTLYHKGVDDIWRRAVRSDEKDTILREAHYGVAGGHYAGDATARKICHRGLWWPTNEASKDALLAGATIGTISKMGLHFLDHLSHRQCEPAKNM